MLHRFSVLRNDARNEQIVNLLVVNFEVAHFDAVLDLHIKQTNIETVRVQQACCMYVGKQSMQSNTCTICSNRLGNFSIKLKIIGNPNRVEADCYGVIFKYEEVITSSKSFSYRVQV